MILKAKQLSSITNMLDFMKRIGAISNESWLIGHGLKWNLIGPKEWSKRP